jgi:hypothetical protein
VAHKHGKKARKAGRHEDAVDNVAPATAANAESAVSMTNKEYERVAPQARLSYIPTPF